MHDDPVKLIHRWFDEVWNEGRESAIDELLSPNGVGHGLGEGEDDLIGPEGFKQFWRTMRTAIPDLKFKVEDAISQGGKVAARVVLTGTHEADGLGAKRSGRKIRILGI